MENHIDPHLGGLIREGYDLDVCDDEHDFSYDDWSDTEICSLFRVLQSRWAELEVGTQVLYLEILQAHLSSLWGLPDLEWLAHQALRLTGLETCNERYYLYLILDSDDEYDDLDDQWDRVLLHLLQRVAQEVEEQTMTGQSRVVILLPWTDNIAEWQRSPSHALLSPIMARVRIVAAQSLRLDIFIDEVVERSDWEEFLPTPNPAKDFRRLGPSQLEALFSIKF